MNKSTSDSQRATCSVQFKEPVVHVFLILTECYYLNYFLNVIGYCQPFVSNDVIGYTSKTMSYNWTPFSGSENTIFTKNSKTFHRVAA